MIRDRSLALASIVGAVLIVALAPFPISTRLTRSYVRSLLAYEDTRYVWGGETSTGIDCPSLLRLAMTLWWHDATAKMLGDGLGGLTVRIGAAESIRQLADGRLAPGDFAVTHDGVHVLAYLGGSRWIQADPNVSRVVAIDRTDDDPWLSRPVLLCRWAPLQN